MRAPRRTASNGYLPALTVAVVCLAVTGCRSPRVGSDPHRPDALHPSAETLAIFARGVLYELQGHPVSAVRAYLDAAEQDPAHPKPYERAIAAHGEARIQGQPTDLPDRLEGLSKRHPRESEPLRWLARVHADEDRPADTTHAYERAMRIHPARAHLHAEHLFHLLRMERHEDLPDAFRLAFQYTRGAPELVAPAAEWLRRAHAEERTEGRSEALQTLNRLARAHPQRADVLAVIAHAFHTAEEADRADQAFLLARAAAPSRTETHAQWALSRIENEDYRGARAVLVQGLETAAQPIDLLHLLVEVALRHSVRLEETDREVEAAEARREALAAVRRLLESVPNDRHARLRLADLLLLAGRQEEAVAELRRLHDTLDPRILQDVVRRFMAADAREDAIALLARFADRHPRDTATALLLADLLNERHQPAQAIEVLQRAVAAGNRHPDLRIRLALLLAQEERSEQALAAVLELLPDAKAHAGLLELAVHLLLENARVDEALEILDKLDRPDGPDEHRGHMTAYRALAQQVAGDTSAAAETLGRRFLEDETLLERFIHLAHHLDGTDDATLATLKALRARHPGHPAILMHEGLYHHLAGRPAQAAEAYAETRKAAGGREDAPSPLTAHFFFLFGAARERTGRDAEAMELLAEAIRRDPDHADALNYLAYMWAEHGLHLNQALAYILRALEFDPDNAAYIDTLGWIYFRQGRYEEAKTELLRALDHRPDDPTIADHVGDVMDRLDRPEEAIDHWKRALENDPENPGEIRVKLRGHGIELPELETPSDGLQRRPDGVDP